MVIVYWVLLTITGTVALFYRSRAKYFESLFELSKSYGKGVWTSGGGSPDEDETLQAVITKKLAKGEFNKATPKLNKDGSVAKKRGRKLKA